MEIAAKLNMLCCIQRLSGNRHCAQPYMSWRYYGRCDSSQSCSCKKCFDGRLAVMEKNESVNDPAAIGECSLLLPRRPQERIIRSCR